MQVNLHLYGIISILEEKDLFNIKYKPSKCWPGLGGVEFVLTVTNRRFCVDNVELSDPNGS